MVGEAGRRGSTPRFANGLGNTTPRDTMCVGEHQNHSGDKRGGIVAASMTREQIAEAQALALEWANR